MSKDDHKIDADDRNVFDVLNERKYMVDYFQREYSWEQKHIEQLVTDLTSTFLDVYTEGDPRTSVEHYNNYYLGPFVVSSKDGMKSIIDGQQRLTSLTLFLIFLNNLQKELGGKESIEPLVFSERWGQKSFNIQVEERKKCLEKLFLEGCYEVQPDDDESTVNMARRYDDIGEAFPEEIKGNAFPYFLDWLKYKVILVEITAYSDDNAYTIFESMNDRGLNLTSTEMLKGYILSRFKEEKPGWEQVFYHCNWGIADSLGFPLMLAPLKSTDSPDVTRQKINEVARFMETFAVRRSINFRKFGASSIRYTMYSLVKELRGKDLHSLGALLKAKLAEMPEKWDGIADFRLHGMNRYFVKFLLSRITGFIEQQSGASTNFSTYFVSPGTKPYEVEHIWADKFDEHRDEFEQQHEFDNYRNRIGDLVLPPQGTNQSYGAMTYGEKVEHYLKENLLVKSLHLKAYENNPNFVGMANNLGLKFKAHKAFTKADINDRQTLIQNICEAIWGK